MHVRKICVLWPYPSARVRSTGLLTYESTLHFEQALDFDLRDLKRMRTMAIAASEMVAETMICWRVSDMDSGNIGHPPKKRMPIWRVKKAAP